MLSILFKKMRGQFERERGDLCIFRLLVGPQGCAGTPVSCPPLILRTVTQTQMALSILGEDSSTLSRVF